jgi:hypothetical protein
VKEKVKRNKEKVNAKIGKSEMSTKENQGATLALLFPFYFFLFT